MNKVRIFNNLAYKKLLFIFIDLSNECSILELLDELNANETSTLLPGPSGKYFHSNKKHTLFTLILTPYIFI
jgi:hypothetical protein